MVPYWYDAVTDSVRFKKNEQVTITVFFQPKSIKMPQVLYHLGKPVIYVYPEKPTKINLSLNVKGKMTYSYPLYQNGWSFTAKPSGNIECKNRNYNYLFWEGEQDLSNLPLDTRQGFFVSSDTLTFFFENTLAKAGLNAKETQDFITYWVPKMQKNEYNYVRFIFNKDYDHFATITIDPKPDNLIRVFMLWQEMAKDNHSNIRPQVFPPFSRKGYTIIEWGGSELGSQIDKIN